MGGVVFGGITKLKKSLDWEDCYFKRPLHKYE
ncbi:hypothetical protein THERMOS_47 [Bathymodiolus thermophilus thioautotrophic gill symbiont]|uniref:Uncharacterized protein n=1 Tax=Bathymodiolus thermophilus thioautotrophic gill symbiont TaxID=2360 RepID=A0A8H8XAQ2_9GAMM|nr:hypothetical protein THERMOS_47 [Bathymodiolus thermophilus thioautotrophic gill symbiont]